MNNKIVWTDSQSLILQIQLFAASDIKGVAGFEKLPPQATHAGSREHRIVVILGRLGAMASLTVTSRGVVVVRWRMVNRTIRLRL